MPMLHSGAGLFFLSPEGIIDAVTAAGASALEGPDATAIDETITVGDEPETETGKPVEEVVEDTKEEESNQAVEEAKKFLKWLRKGYRNRSFNFEHVEPEYAEIINKYVALGDEESARWHMERYLGL